MKEHIISATIGALVTVVIGAILLLSGTFSKLLIDKSLQDELVRTALDNDQLVKNVAREVQSKGELKINKLTANEIIVGNDKVVISYDKKGGKIILHKADGERAAMILVEDQGRGGVFRAWDLATTRHIDLEAVNGVRQVNRK